MPVKPLSPTDPQPDSSASSHMLIQGAEVPQQCLCSYQNQSGVVQVIRISDAPQQHLERVVFPGQRLMFYAPSQAQLKVYTGNQAGALLTDTLVCDRIQVSSSSVSPS